MFLRQSTASQEILLGPFVDFEDGNTAETGLTIANTDIKVWKSGATTEASKNSGGATHIASGRYYAVLDATDTDTLGNLEINVHVAGALAVRRAFTVLPANVFDSIVLGSDKLETDVLQIGGDTQSATDLKDFADAGYDPATNKVQGLVLADAITDKAGFSLASTGLNAVVMTEPADEAGWGDSVVVGIAHLAAIAGHINKTYVTRTSSTAGTLTVRNFADDATLWTHALTDDGTTSTVGKAT
jgi:hypothetical protein